MSLRCPESQQKSHARRGGKLGEESRRWAGAGVYVSCSPPSTGRGPAFLCPRGHSEGKWQTRKRVTGQEGTGRAGDWLVPAHALR